MFVHPDIREQINHIAQPALVEFGTSEILRENIFQSLILLLDRPHRIVYHLAYFGRVRLGRNPLPAGFGRDIEDIFGRIFVLVLLESFALGDKLPVFRFELIGNIFQENDNIQFLVLREYTPDQRRDIIRWALHEEQNIGLVIIDGIRDLIHDINSPSESLDIINELMRWSSYYELHIHTVLHLNKGDDNTRGHIGTELNNKAETILQISKNNENGKISEVRAMHIRDREFTPFAFEIGEDSLPHLVKEHQFKKNKMDRLASYIDMTEQQHRTALEVAFEECAEYGYQSLLEALKKGYESIGYSRGRNTLVNLCKFLLESHAITKNGRTYSYNPSFHL